MKAHAENARAIYEFLKDRDDVAEVFYPGFGAIVSFRPRGGVTRAHQIAESLQTFALAVSLGGVESLVCFPAKMTHGSLTPEERAARGVTDDLLRLSVGIETTQDLIDDLHAALAKSTITEVCGRSSELISATLSV
jgi:cystathionine beta-lyase/cystathionine gamma-synthase